MLKRLWRDQSGVLVTAEIVLVASILILGVLAGLTAVRNAVSSELGDFATGIARLDQSYYFSGTVGCGAYTAGGYFNDRADYCDQHGVLVCADFVTEQKCPCWFHR